MWVCGSGTLGLTPKEAYSVWAINQYGGADAPAMIEEFWSGTSCLEYESWGWIREEVSSDSQESNPEPAPTESATNSAPAIVEVDENEAVFKEKDNPAKWISDSLPGRRHGTSVAPLTSQSSLMGDDYMIHCDLSNNHDPIESLPDWLVQKFSSVRQHRRFSHANWAAYFG